MPPITLILYVVLKLKNQKWTSGVFLILLALEILLTVEENMNRIWKAEKKRSLWRKLGMFFIIMVLAPLVTVMAIQGSVWIVGIVQQIELEATTFILPSYSSAN